MLSTALFTTTLTGAICGPFLTVFVVYRFGLSVLRGVLV